jgi:hypothetical protein
MKLNLLTCLKMLGFRYYGMINQVFFQMMKIFYLVRVNKKIMQTIPNISAENLTIPDYYTDHSNFISQGEGLLMRWLDLNFEAVFKLPSRIKNFDQDLQNCLHFAAAIYNYTGKSSDKYFALIRRQCFNDEDCLFNADKIIQMLDDLGIVTHFSKRDFINCNSRDNIIFTIQM